MFTIEMKEGQKPAYVLLYRPIALSKDIDGFK